MAQRVALGDVAATGLQRHHQLHLMMHVAGHGRVGHVHPARQHRISRFGEKERRLAVRIMPHLARMGGVVAANAEDAPHGKRAAPGDGHGSDSGRGDHIIGHNGGPWIDVAGPYQ